jgi:hypothetical protein
LTSPGEDTWGELPELADWDERSQAVLSRDDIEIIRVTPHPVLARLQRVGNGVVRGVRVAGGVLVLGLVAAADLPTGHAHPQVNPGVPQLQALQAALGIPPGKPLRVRNGQLDLVYVRTWVGVLAG